MILIFDHLLATLIAAGLFMALVATQVRVQQAGIEQVSAHAAKTKAISLGSWLEQDITSLGANFGNNLMRFTEPDTNAAGHTTEWQFYSDSVAAFNAITRHVTRYKLFATDTIEVDGVERQLYELRRDKASTPVVSGSPLPIPASGWSSDGRSVATLSQFDIDLVRSDGQVTDQVATADYIRVEFAMVPEFERERGYLRELFWATTLKVRPFWQPPPS